MPTGNRTEGWIILVSPNQYVGVSRTITLLRFPFIIDRLQNIPNDLNSSFVDAYSCRHLIGNWTQLSNWLSIVENDNRNPCLHNFLDKFGALRLKFRGGNRFHRLIPVRLGPCPLLPKIEYASRVIPQQFALGLLRNRLLEHCFDAPRISAVGVWIVRVPCEVVVAN